MTAGELPYTLAVHAGLSQEPGVADNPHLHLVFSERVNDGVAGAAEQWFRSGGAGGRDPASGGATKSKCTKLRTWLPGPAPATSPRGRPPPRDRGHESGL